MFDIAIIGLGPAGATLARLLDKNMKVIAIDKKSGGRGFSKPCGGLLATDAQKALSRFELTLPKDVLVDPQIFAVRTLDTKQDLLRHYQRFYINMDRERFDNWLVSLIPDNVKIEAGAACTGIKETAEGFIISYAQNGEYKTVSAKYVVGADGSYSKVRTSLFPKRKIRRYLSIQQWFSEENPKPFYSCIFDRDITDSYCWSISKNGFFILGGAFPENGARKRFEQLKAKLEKQNIVIGKAVKTEACFVSSPRGMRSFCTGKGGAFLIGEAAGFISPSSLEGISYALNSALYLSEVFNSKPSNLNRAYFIKTLPMRFKLLAKYIKSPFMYNPFLRKCVMKSGLNAIKIIKS